MDTISDLLQFPNTLLSLNPSLLARPLVLTFQTVKCPSGVEVPLVKHSIKAAIHSLLSCPILNRDDNYLFHDDNIFSPPPKSLTELSDINSGLCYRHTSKQLINPLKNEVLLLIPVFIDATHLDAYGRMKMEPVTITLGIFNQQTRAQAMAWRPIGYLRKDSSLASTSNSNLQKKMIVLCGDV